jgi:hypothetical protein
MEFPGMANDAALTGEEMEKWTGVKMNDFQANLGLTIHEMCHMYFPFMMGTHEKKYAWMEEGMASFTSRFLNQNAETNPDKYFLGSQIVTPIIVPTYIFQNPEINFYTMASYSYFSLYKLLGKNLFSRCLKAYMDTWKHKHPIPYDFMFTFNKVSDVDLN